MGYQRRVHGTAAATITAAAAPDCDDDWDPVVDESVC